MLISASPSSRRARGAALAIAVLLALLCGTDHAAAQDSIFAPYIGATTGGDTRKTGATFGFSTAYIEENGWGGELDVAYVTDFNDEDFASTSLATAMLNVIIAPRVTPRLRPFAVAGLGLIRARGCGGPTCVTEFSRTDLGVDLGGGAMVPINDIFGVRGDVRYFRYVQIHQDLPRTGNGPFDFWRISGGGTVTW